MPWSTPSESRLAVTVTARQALAEKPMSLKAPNLEFGSGFNVTSSHSAKASNVHSGKTAIPPGYRIGRDVRYSASSTAQRITSTITVTYDDVVHNRVRYFPIWTDLDPSRLMTRRFDPREFPDETDPTSSRLKPVGER